MQIKIKTSEDEEKVVSMRQPKGKEVWAIREKLTELQEKSKEGKEMSILIGYLKFIDEISVKCGKIDGKPLTLDFLDDLPQDQKEKITSVVGYAAFGELDFTKLFGKPTR